jgi:hypothetical protein
MTADSHYKFYQGPWKEGRLPVLLIIGWQKVIDTQKTRVEAYTLIPTAPPTLDSQPPICLQAGLNPSPQISERRLLATRCVESKLSELIPTQCRPQYPDLFPYKFSEVTNNKGEFERLSQGLRDCYAVTSKEMQDLLKHEVEDKTRCEALRDCLRTLHEGSLGDQTGT